MKKLLLALSLALMLVLALGVPALAGDGYFECWEEEGYLDSWVEEGYLDVWNEEGYWDTIPEVSHQEPDTLMLDNDDFYLALGYVKTNPKWYDSTDESHYGGNSRKPDGYDIYQDDGSGEGWLGCIKGLLIGVPGPPVGPYIGEDAYYFNTEPGTYLVTDTPGSQEWIVTREAGEEWMVIKEAGEEWVVTKEAGCSFVDGGPDGAEEFTVIIGGAKSPTYTYCGCAVEDEVVFSSGSVQITLPKGLHMIKANGGNARWIEFSAGGGLVSNITFKSGEPIVTKLL